MKMTKKIAISLSDYAFAYLNEVTDNRSAYLENSIFQQQQKDFEAKLEQAYIDQENDPEFHEEIAAWDCTTGDGIN